MAIIFPIIILLAIIILTSGSTLIKNFGFPETTQELVVRKESFAKPLQKSLGNYIPRQNSVLRPAPQIVLDTSITKGPKEKEILSQTNIVTFEFSGNVIPQDTKGSVTFETKIEGFDKDWVPTKNKNRTVTLPGGVAQYTFYVRSKLGNTVDLAPASRTFRVNTSPFMGKISISSFTPTKGNTPFGIGITPKLAKGQTIDITGWKIESKWTGSFTIKQGVENYQPNINQQTSNILVKSSDTVSILGKAAPIGNEINFRTNKCFGYLKIYYPSLPGPSSCSHRKPTTQEVSHLNPVCQDYILKKIDYSSCRLPNYASVAGIGNNPECAAYLSSLTRDFNYNSCFLQHSNDSTFTENKWYIYTNRTFGHPLHDVITITDQNGLFVTQKVY